MNIHITYGLKEEILKRINKKHSVFYTFDDMEEITITEFGAYVYTKDKKDYYTGNFICIN